MSTRDRRNFVAVESQAKVEKLVALQEDLRGRVQGAGKRGVAERLAADLVGLPFVSRADVVHRYRLSGQGAINAINTLAEIGILRPAFRTRRRAQVWVAAEVVAIAAR